MLDKTSSFTLPARNAQKPLFSGRTATSGAVSNPFAATGHQSLMGDKVQFSGRFDRDDYEKTWDGESVLHAPKSELQADVSTNLVKCPSLHTVSVSGADKKLRMQECDVSKNVATDGDIHAIDTTVTSGTTSIHGSITGENSSLGIVAASQGDVKLTGSRNGQSAKSVDAWGDINLQGADLGSGYVRSENGDATLNTSTAGSVEAAERIAANGSKLGRLKSSNADVGASDSTIKNVWAQTGIMLDNCRVVGVDDGVGDLGLGSSLYCQTGRIKVIGCPEIAGSIISLGGPIEMVNSGSRETVVEAGQTATLTGSTLKKASADSDLNGRDIDVKEDLTAEGAMSLNRAVVAGTAKAAKMLTTVGGKVGSLVSKTSNIDANSTVVPGPVSANGSIIFKNVANEPCGPLDCKGDLTTDACYSIQSLTSETGNIKANETAVQGGVNAPMGKIDFIGGDRAGALSGYGDINVGQCAEGVRSINSTHGNANVVEADVTQGGIKAPNGTVSVEYGDITGPIEAKDSVTMTRESIAKGDVTIHGQGAKLYLKSESAVQGKVIFDPGSNGEVHVDADSDIDDSQVVNGRVIRGAA